MIGATARVRLVYSTVIARSNTGMRASGHPEGLVLGGSGAVDIRAG